MAAAIGVAALICGLVSLRLTRRIFPLGEDALRRIMEINSTPNHTGADEQLLLTPYKKMWFEITGTLGEVGSSHGKRG